MAKEVYYLSNNGAYATDSRRWLSNISGANAWGVTFTVGDGETFPDCMQHQVANLVGSLNGQPPVLDGAVVEGPTECFILRIGERNVDVSAGRRR
jgi:endoglucanase